MKGTARWMLEHFAKLAFAIVGKIFIYGLVIISAISILLLPLAIMSFLNDEDNAALIVAHLDLFNKDP